MNFKVVIPARYASTRLPGKPLLNIGGKPMIQHVHTRAIESGADQVVVATDDIRIADCVRDFGGEVCITQADHRSGTDRIAEVVKQYGWQEDEIVVNLQGDEPDMPSALLLQVAKDMAAHTDASMTTLSAKMSEKSQLFDPNVVKLVTDAKGYALYFSRAPIPWNRDQFADQANIPDLVEGHHRHIGLYAYRAGFLARYVQWQPAPLEALESLEQLRVLWQGEKIHVSEATIMPGHGVDTQQDLDLVNRLFQQRSN
ncbi:3-deoxy-manno-octulosonate cytidylyltransferase [Sedimenticola selenatireducens]|jgi:3-deoxy-manno-octulosonate cytidylyltransferase (CMP-KDO synthetase)|uniref:3-deoxy-manno-octulosonate cytidylyltransferase n=1 Tax=Sedimenticola selenatireducens TaxID=191960 RepID=A0A558DJR6_9GAMM|nr:3-deoxy-manno-octulosonate cytidylyltransferase [Sedimenticola selenatireducens]TVO68878.1 3-deoxy-manno-octulosonate cytidylyltransferase [Sedimenticola selenatireducens]TVT61250.1 MAG: 3-deoxy-manno-octulosonate cytidylyltransferase [Sedimenticola selenatireducens]